MEDGRDGKDNLVSHEDVEQGEQIEMSMNRLSNLLALFKEKVNALDASVNSLEEKITSYANELSSIYKDVPGVESTEHK